MVEELESKILNKLTKHIDEAMMHSHQSKDKEMSGLMSDLRKRLDEVVKDVKSVNTNLKKLSDDVGEFNHELERVETKLKNNLEKHELETKANHHEHDRRISFTEKAIMAAGSVILLSVLYAVLRQIGL